MLTLETEDPRDGFNLNIDEVRMLVRFRALADHQKKGILQAIELMQPAAPTKPLRREQR